MHAQTSAGQRFSRSRAWVEKLQQQRDRLLQRVAELVHQESPTSQPEGVSTAQSMLAGWAEELGGRVLRHLRTGSAGVLEARFGDPDDPRRPVLLLGHLDTVWPMGTLACMPWRVKDGWAYGPGVLDMKAGVVMAIEALRLVRAVDPARPVVMLLSGDEETGSHDSRELIEAIARGCRAVFVLEPAQGPQGAYKTMRKGVGHFRLEVSGVPSHSGVDFNAGHSAVRELAWQIEQIGALTDTERGTTLNVGVIGGGTQPNVVAAAAWAEIDVRVATLKDGEEIERRLRGLEPRDPECRLAVSGALNRPPMERTPGTVALFELAQAMAAELGIPLEEAATGGGSDGNFTSALGVPTLDGMGAVGKGAHADNESIEVDSLVYRTALLAEMIARTI
ncbi:MAG: peptidase dimerization domain protein [Acidobacteriaceae bacterium]|nr:peptidase dimerization domain protein [Acidobacteriaceae bacterium]